MWRHWRCRRGPAFVLRQNPAWQSLQQDNYFPAAVLSLALQDPVYAGDGDRQSKSCRHGKTRARLGRSHQLGDETGDPPSRNERPKPPHQLPLKNLRQPLCRPVCRGPRVESPSALEHPSQAVSFTTDDKRRVSRSSPNEECFHTASACIRSEDFAARHRKPKPAQSGRRHSSGRRPRRRTARLAGDRRAERGVRTSPVSVNRD